MFKVFKLTSQADRVSINVSDNRPSDKTRGWDTSSDLGLSPALSCKTFCVIYFCMFTFSYNENVILNFTTNEERP